MCRKCVYSIVILFASFFYSLHADASIVREREFYEKRGDVIWDYGMLRVRYISITFDDGPNPEFTPKILDLLAKYNAKATFFITGEKAEKHPKLVKRIVNEGHEIGNHTYSHMYNANISEEVLTDELTRTAEIIKGILGFSPILYRPVGGLYNDSIVATAKKNNYQVVLWSWHQDPKDWMNPGVQKIVSHVQTGMKPGDIILLHDSGGDRSQTIEALELILKDANRKKFNAVTVSELMILSEEIPPFLFSL
ncbi:polysaccharide deacetylase family protein [Bacillus sp. CRN 9]|uniref:polysaccharide deacetylase family protein n=1 Tax=Cytobacillus horneckiae TaxID=549687 RepID=UPI002AA57A7E